MKLTVDNKPIALKRDDSISIERSSPLLNDDTGSFSYSFTVPRKINQAVLGWPGKLSRGNTIPVQKFLLEEDGIQIFSGEVDYDQVSEDEIGMVLKSGFTEFRAKMEGKKLNEIGYGHETFLPAGFTRTNIMLLLSTWDEANASSNGKYCVAPFMYRGEEDTDPSGYGNKIDYTDGTLTFSSATYGEGYFMLQFYASFILESILESAGYMVIENQFADSEFGGLVVFSKIFKISLKTPKFGIPDMTAGDDLYYSKLMPEVEVLEFLDTLSNSMFSIMLDIDDRTRRVKILMKKNIFLSENLVKTKLEEVQPWEHSENKPEGGFKISYSNQDNDLDTKSDYKIDGTVTLNLPTPTEEGIIYHRNYDNNDYITVADGETLSWQRIGKLKDYSEGNASDGIEIDFKIPALVYGENAMYFPQVVVKYLPKVMEFANLEEIYVSLYRGMIDDVNVVLYPTITDVQTSDSGTTLTPEYLFNACHKDFLRWKAFDARKFTKYFRMTLPEVMALKWDKRYLVNGVEIIIERINFDLPYDGIVQIDGYTGKTPS